MNEWLQKHFESYKDKDNRKPHGQKYKITMSFQNHKIQGSKAENGKDIRSKHNERVSGNAENRGHRVKSKHNIGKFNDHEYNKEDGDAKSSMLFHKKFSLAVFFGNMNYFFDPSNNKGFMGIVCFFSLEKDADASKNKEGSKDIKHPMECGYQCRAYAYHDASHD